MRIMFSNEAPDAYPVRKFTIHDAQDWMEWSGVSLGDVVNDCSRRCEIGRKIESKEVILVRKECQLTREQILL
jgi:hypothetical protein